DETSAVRKGGLEGAGGRAAVAGGEVAVVALLGEVQIAVAARLLRRAGRAAAVAVRGVAVVAGLEAVADAVAAALVAGADGVAAVARHVVAVVACFARVEPAVAACGQHAGDGGRPFLGGGVAGRVGEGERPVYAARGSTARVGERGGVAAVADGNERDVSGR